MKKGVVPGAELAQIAVRAATAAGKVLMKHFGKPLQVNEKPGAGLVTHVDLAAEAAALAVLKRARPDFALLTEESHPQGMGGARGSKSAAKRARGRWILDPLDGTTNYVHGFPMFCVSIAAEWDGHVVAGVIYHPVLKDTYVAVAGRGAKLNGKPLKASKTRRLENSLLTTGFTYRKDEWLGREMQSFERLSGVARAIRRPGSAALDLAYTARGVFDGFWERRLSPWDVAAGALLVQEAGGKVTDFLGKPFRLADREILATNGHLHEMLLEAISPSSDPGV